MGIESKQRIRVYNKMTQFWLDIARRLDWIKFPSRSGDYSFTPPVHIKWYEDGKLNACYNCVDRHIEKDQTALIWVNDTGEIVQHIAYKELFRQVNKMAHFLKTQGVQKGDRVIIYMPMILESVYSMLACARIGAVHSVVFGGFSPQSLKNRIEDCNAKYIITANEGVRGSKTVPLKKNVDEALVECDFVQRVIIVQHTDTPIDVKPDIDVFYEPSPQDVFVPCEVMQAEDPLFILYTSGSTGTPKGVLHTTGGYLTYASYTHEKVFDLKEKDIYWCTADIGWITGHSYVVYGPLVNGTTSVIFEGVPTYPTPDILWKLIDQLKVTIFYTAPTAIRSLLQLGNKWLETSSRSSLRVLGSVGEPINEEAWKWYFEKIGNSQCHIADTWWQTETGGIMITPKVGTTPLKPGSAMHPVDGIDVVIMDEDKNEADKGYLLMRQSWPGQMRTIFGRHDVFEKTYFAKFEGYYMSGDGAYKDADQHIWITGRIDDILNVSGHRLATAEIETAATLNPVISEAAAVGIPHPIKGEAILIFVIPSAEHTMTEVDLIHCVKQEIRKNIGPIAVPERVVVVQGLPKTRSGKIMRRILRAIARGEHQNLGDTTTLADPSIIDHLLLKTNLEND